MWDPTQGSVSLSGFILLPGSVSPRTLCPSLHPLTGPLMVPDANRSPGRRLQPLTVWCVSCCSIVQYMCCGQRSCGLSRHKSQVVPPHTLLISTQPASSRKHSLTARLTAQLHSLHIEQEQSSPSTISMALWLPSGQSQSSPHAGNGGLKYSYLKIGPADSGRLAHALSWWGK